MIYLFITEVAEKKKQKIWLTFFSSNMLNFSIKFCINKRNEKNGWSVNGSAFLPLLTALAVLTVSWTTEANLKG